MVSHPSRTSELASDPSSAEKALARGVGGGTQAGVVLNLDKEIIMAYNLSHLNPFARMARYEPMRGFDELLQEFQLGSLRDFASEPRIKIDVSENEHAYTVKAEIPGVKKEDIKVDVEQNQVSISAEMHKESEQKVKDTIVCSERYVGQQYRSFMLAHEIDDGKVEAKYHDGVLELTLPKKSPVQGKKIVIN